MRTVKIAAAIIACAIQAYGAATVTASRDYVDRKTTLHPYSNGVEQIGYILGTQTNKVLASKEYVDDSISESSPGDYNTVSNAAVKSRAKTDMVVYDTNGVSTVDRLATTGDVEVAVNRVRTDRITDGTNIIDAARMVFQLQDGYGEWSWTIEPEAADASFEIHWGDSYGVYDGWYFDGGIGEWGGPDYYLGGDVTSTNLTYTGFFGHETEYTVTFSRPVIHGSLTNIVGRLALTNDVSQVASLARSKTDLAVYASETTQWRCIYVEPSGAYSNLTNMNLWTLDPYPYDGVIYPNVYYDGTFMFDSSEIMIEDEYNKATLWTIYGSGESGDGIRISFSRQVAGLDTGNRLATTSDIPSVVSAYTYHAIEEFSRTGTVERAHSIYDGTNTIDAAGSVSVSSMSPWQLNTNGIYAIDMFYDASHNRWTNSVEGEVFYIAYVSGSWTLWGGTYPDMYADGSEDSLFATFNDTTLSMSRQSVHENKYVGKLALTNDIPDAPDFSTGNTQLVATIEAKAPAPGNYSVVSNAAMNARSITDIGVRGLPVDGNSWFVINGTRLDNTFANRWGEGGLFIDRVGDNQYLFGAPDIMDTLFALESDFTATVEGYHITGYTNTLAQVSQITNIHADVRVEGSFSQGTNTTASGAYSHAEGDRTIASGKASHAEGVATRAQAEASHASGVNVFVTQRATFGAGVSVSGTNSASFIWSGSETSPWYGTHGKGSFNVNPIGGAYGFFIGNDNLIQVISSSLLAEEPQEVTIEYDDGQPVTTNYPSLRAVVEQIVLETIRKNSLSGIYDQQLQTWWTPVMVNGGYKFMATTNIDMNAESEY